VIDTVGHHFSHRQFFFLDELAKAHPCAAIVVQFIVAKEADVNYISGRNFFDFVFQFQFRTNNGWFHNYKVFIVTIL
jgi:hypothetical protein